MRAITDGYCNSEKRIPWMKISRWLVCPLLVERMADGIHSYSVCSCRCTLFDAHLDTIQKEERLRPIRLGECRDSGFDVSVDFEEPR